MNRVVVIIFLLLINYSWAEELKTNAVITIEKAKIFIDYKNADRGHIVVEKGKNIYAEEKIIDKKWNKVKYKFGEQIINGYIDFQSFEILTTTSNPQEEINKNEYEEIKFKNEPKYEEKLNNSQDSNFGIFIEPTIAIVGGAYTQELTLNLDTEDNKGAGSGTGFSIRAGFYRDKLFIGGFYAYSKTQLEPDNELFIECEAKVNKIGGVIGLTFPRWHLWGELLTGTFKQSSNNTKFSGPGLGGGVGWKIIPNLSFNLYFAFSIYNEGEMEDGTSFKLPYTETSGSDTLTIGELNYTEFWLSVSFPFYLTL